MSFKDNLRARREGLGITQAELAKTAGITTRTLYNYVSGERRPSNIEVVQRIANALGTTAEELLSSDDALDGAMRALNEAYWIAKDKNKKYARMQRSADNE